MLQQLGSKLGCDSHKGEEGTYAVEDATRSVLHEVGGKVSEDSTSPASCKDRVVGMKVVGTFPYSFPCEDEEVGTDTRAVTGWENTKELEHWLSWIHH